MPLRARRTGAALGAAVLCMLSASACGGAPPPPGPEVTVRRYMEAVRAGDAEGAYALLDPATRAEVPFARFVVLMDDNRGELLAQASKLEEALRGPPPIPRARARLADGDTVTLVWDGERWRPEAGVVHVPVLRTPRDAVRALRRALADRSLRGVTRVLSRRTRADLEAELDRLVEDTADPLDLDFEVRGDEARVRTTSGRRIRLVREAGEWRVVDVQDPDH